MYEKMKSLYKDEINEMINNAVTEVNKEKDKLLAQRDKRIEELEAELARLKKA